MEVGLGENGHMRVLKVRWRRPVNVEHARWATTRVNGETEGNTDLTDELALHEDAHGHVQSKELSLHLELHVVLCRLPLGERQERRVNGSSCEDNRNMRTFSRRSWTVFVLVTSAARLRGPCLRESWRPKLLVVSWTEAVLES